MVADPRKFLWEALPLEDRGFTVLDRLFIDERTMVSDLTHRLLDLAWEDYRVYVLNEPPRDPQVVELLLLTLMRSISSRSSTMSFWNPKKHTPKSFSRRADRALDMIQHVCRVTPERWASFFDILTEAETPGKPRVDQHWYFQC